MAAADTDLREALHELGMDPETLERCMAVRPRGGPPPSKLDHGAGGGERT